MNDRSTAVELRRMMAVAALALGAAVSLQGCDMLPRAPLPTVAPADTLAGKFALDGANDSTPAQGLVVRLDVPADTATTYSIVGQLFQDPRRGPVAYANERGHDASHPGATKGQPTAIRAERRGPLPIALWFPGSEIHRRGRAGAAWVDIEVSRPTWKLRSTAKKPDSVATRWYRTVIDSLDPAAFVARLPKRKLPPLPPPAADSGAAAAETLGTPASPPDSAAHTR